MILHELSFGLTLIDLVEKNNTKSIGESKLKNKKQRGQKNINNMEFFRIYKRKQHE
jgi:hypothetical protein